jgi:hypothetical protein
MSKIDDITSLFKADFKTLGPKLVLPALTLLGAWGGFPTPPKSFSFLAKNRFFQYFFLWVLVMQGGASADPDLSLVAVLIFVLFAELVKYFERRSEEKKLQT